MIVVYDCDCLAYAFKSENRNTRKLPFHDSIFKSMLFLEFLALDSLSVWAFTISFNRALVNKFYFVSSD